MEEICLPYTPKSHQVVSLRSSGRTIPAKRNQYHKFIRSTSHDGYLELRMQSKMRRTRAIVQPIATKKLSS